MDSRTDTWQHIHEVEKLMTEIVRELLLRSMEHDKSKLEDPEVKGFNEHTAKLKLLEYGSPEYQASLEALKPTLAHHYANNAHHPEHFERGVDDMTLVDIVEMLCDWKAATKRQKDGNIRKSLTLNRSRFHMSDQLFNILANTIERLGW